MYSFFEQRFMGDYYNPQKSILKKSKRLKQLTKVNQKAKIVQALVLKGITQKKVAELANVKPSCVSSIINGRARSYNVEQIITQLTGYKFPDFERVPRSLAANN